VSFGVRRAGEPLEAGASAEFFSGAMAAPTMGRDGSGHSGVVPASIGESTIARSDKLRRQGPERVMAGAPKFWQVKNRAENGNVKVWMGVFNGELFPDGCDPDDKHTWLQAGDSMMLPLDAALHFFGNVFDPRTPEAMEIIERCGGFELETQKANPGRNAEVRVIGGPIGLPDFVITPIDGRLKPIGISVELYPHYWGAVRKKVLKVRKDKDPEVVENERLLLAERIREYTLEDDPDAGALYDGSGRVVSTSASREADEAAPAGAPNMREQFENNDPDAVDESTELEDATPPTRRGGRPART
jgi:hypothetical protein